MTAQPPASRREWLQRPLSGFPGRLPEPGRGLSRRPSLGGGVAPRHRPLPAEGVSTCGPGQVAPRSGGLGAVSPPRFQGLGFGGACKTAQDTDRPGAGGGGGVLAWGGK